ncbi:hypothetical protein FISHEDRAFT_51547 [Fistulina hepatica ATCC 64428]|uniref:Uncharacterized protein n=1 Tax=Fistulina hepatica ATCC 64428 TaxID=1128425 RepID=A0A0D7A0V4_9AGAR|nr:hypothetical protein FISHEDRAFT_51547 [Fistulina hepatica ATCC 64428]
MGLGLDPAASVAVGAIVALSAVRYGAGQWERAKKRWLQDSFRVIVGLDRDIKTVVDRVIKNQVTAVANRGCTGLVQILRTRHSEIDAVREELRALQGQVASAERA